ncbi:hypothetical protein JOQ06_026034 [Pogonophryne albipinna]|uniref:Uncharacterized protein n=1 Tax=Pogonophryne albipinna TaxID=1090488 RepID=A0AAD6A9U6_9TELE|nr:hypothetical protein JOQ06_026034 [Pogonophryne albipinna]
MSLIIGALFFVKPIRSKNYVTLMDPFQEKYGNKVSAVLFIPALIGDILWIACVLAALVALPSSANFTVAAVTKLHQEPWIGRLELEDAGRWVENILLMAIGGICYQAFYQRVLSTATDAQAKITCYAAAAFCPILGIPSILIGAVAASTSTHI